MSSFIIQHHTDGHGSVRQLADSTGTVTDTYAYDAWGNLIDSTGTTPNSYLYCGEQLDSTTGLYYLRARYMNPTTGTFTTMDTYQGSLFDPVSLHKYLYANANPVMNVDPSGYATHSLSEMEVAVAGFTILAAAEAMSNSFALNYYRHFKSNFGCSILDHNWKFDNVIFTLIATGLIVFTELNEFIIQETMEPNIVYSKNQAPTDTDTLKWSDKSRKQFNKKLPPDWREKIRKAIDDFLSGRSKHNDHPLKGDRAGQRSKDHLILQELDLVEVQDVLSMNLLLKVE